MAEAAAETAAEAAAKAAAEAAVTAAAATTTTATSNTAAGTSRLAPRSVASPLNYEARAKPRPSMGTRAREAAAKTFKHLLWPLSPSRPARASSPASPGRSPVGRPAARPALRPLPTPSDDDAPPMLMMAPMGALSTARSPAPPSAQSRRRPVASPRADAVPSTWAEAGEPLATAAARQEDVNVKALSTADTVTVASATLSGCAAGRPPVVSPPATPPLRRQLTAETVHSLAEESRAPRRPLSPASQESSDSSNSSDLEGWDQLGAHRSPHRGRQGGGILPHRSPDRGRQGDGVPYLRARLGMQGTPEEVVSLPVAANPRTHASPAARARPSPAASPATADAPLEALGVWWSDSARSSDGEGEDDAAAGAAAEAEASSYFGPLCYLPSSLQSNAQSHALSPKSSSSRGATGQQQQQTTAPYTAATQDAMVLSPLTSAAAKLAAGYPSRSPLLVVVILSCKLPMSVANVG